MTASLDGLEAICHLSFLLAISSATRYLAVDHSFSMT